MKNECLVSKQVVRSVGLRVLDGLDFAMWENLKYGPRSTATTSQLFRRPFDRSDPVLARSSTSRSGQLTNATKSISIDVCLERKRSTASTVNRRKFRKKGKVRRIDEGWRDLVLDHRGHGSSALGSV